jgi:F-type H+-transporting ATPase subunit b
MTVLSALTLPVLAAEEGPNPLLPHRSEIVVGLVAFALLYFFLRRSVFPRFEQVYAERRERIEGGIERAEQAQAEAQRTLEQYRAQLAEARHEANAIREDAYVQARQIEQESRARAQEEYERIVARGEEQLAAERQQIVTQLRGEVGRLAVELADKIVGERMQDEALQRRVIDRYLDGVEAGTAVTSTAGERS